LVAGQTGLSLSPGVVSANTCYLRCTKRAGCTTYVESNIISLTTDCNNTPNCANIGISTGVGQITVTGLNGAPVTSVQIFSATWQQVQSCFANCQSPTATYAMPAGTYYVYVKYYTAQYQLVCEVNQTVTVVQALADNESENLQFKAIKYLEHVDLVWSHRGDYKVDEYILERSTDGANYKEIYNTPSDKSTAANVYEGYDFEPSIGFNYYRLRMINVDGNELYSDIQEVYYEEMAKFALFPNPANDFTNINLESVVGMKDVDIHIYNSMGLRMKQFHLDEVWSKYYQMDLRDLHEGYYTVWVNMPGKRPVSTKLVIGKS